MAVAPGTNTTYDAVRDWALNAAGFGTNSEVPCPVDGDVIDSLLLNALQQVHSRIWQDRFYETAWNFTVYAGDERVLDAPAGNIQTYDDLFGTPPLRVIKQMIRRDTDGVTPVYQAQDTLVVGIADSVKDPVRLCWRRFGTGFTVSPPSPDDELFTLLGYRDVSREIYTIGAGPGFLITWQLVDLPDRYVEIYQKIVLGFLLAACGDAQKSQYWLQIANDELNALDSLPDRSLVNEDGGALVMGGNRGSQATSDSVLLFRLPIG